MKKSLCIIISVLLVISCFFGCSKEEKKEEQKEEKASYGYDLAYIDTDKSAVNAYEQLCDCVNEYKTELRLNVGLLDDAQQLFFTSYPLSALVKDIKINSDKSGVVISYKKSEEEHKKTVASFNAKIKGIKEKCLEGTTNENVYAIRLYNYIASNIVKSDDESITCLDTVLTGKGSSFSYSQMFEYLLRENEIQSCHVLASDAAGAGWGIAGAILGGNLYYFDLMTEFHDNQGKLLRFFGMTMEDLKNEGLKDWVFTNKKTAEDASDLKFDTLRKCASWKLDGAKLLVTTITEEVVEIAL